VIPFPLYRALYKEREWLQPGDFEQDLPKYETLEKPSVPPASRMLVPTEFKSLKKKVREQAQRAPELIKE
jgi:predicted component of type VI protein secretion system